MSRPISLTHCNLHLDRNEVEGPEGAIRLTVTECDLLSYLVAQAGRTISKGELLRNVWHYAPGVESRAPDHTVNRLRAKIEADPKNPDHLSTVYGVGYRLDLPGSEVAPEPQAPRLSLPLLASPPKPLRGRQGALDSITESFDAGSQWLTIVGPGGMGKTHLARTLAAGKSSLWCDLRTADTESEAMGIIGAALGLEAAKTVDAAGAQVAQALGALRPDIIVLDNLEQVAPAAIHRIHGWLDDLPDARILATSRTPLRLPRESLLRLQSLSTQSAKALFLERSQAVLGTELAWSESDIHDLMTQLDGLPLAIELAAGRMGILGPSELSARLSEDMGILSGGQEGHHKTLLHTLRRSWALLDPMEREVLAQCTVFERPFDLCAIEAVVSVPDSCDPVLSVVSRLVDASMLQRVEGTQIRFDFYALTRQFVEDQDPEMADVVGRHMVYFHALAVRLRPQQRIAQGAETEQDLRASLPDILVAMEVAERVDPHALTQIVAAIRPLLGREIPLEKAAHVAQTCVRLTEGTAEVEDLCQALSARARVHFVAGRWQESFADLERAISCALDADLLALAAAFENQLGSHLLPRGEVERAEAMYAAGLEHARMVENAWLEGRGLTGLARVQLYADRREAALNYLREALPIIRQVGDREGECRTLGLMGRLESRQGHMAQAELHFRDALDCYRDQMLPGRFTWILASRTEIYLRWGRLEAAERCAVDALAMANIRGTPAERAVAQFNLGMLLLETGSINRAEEELRKAKRGAETIGVRRFVGDVLMGLSWLHFDRQEYARAQAHWTQAEAIHAQTENPVFAGPVLGLQGLCALGEGRIDDGVAALQNALATPGLDIRSSIFFRVALAVGQVAADHDADAQASLQQVIAQDPAHQIDLAAARVIAERLSLWLDQARSPASLDAVWAHLDLCRKPAAADVCAATVCSSELRWLIRLVEQHLSSAMHQAD